MACCNAILERCDPAGPAGDNTVLIFVNSDGSPPTYKNIDGTDWAGDPTTLTNCAGGATVTVVDDYTGTVDDGTTSDTFISQLDGICDGAPIDPSASQFITKELLVGLGLGLTVPWRSDNGCVPVTPPCPELNLSTMGPDGRQWEWPAGGPWELRHEQLSYEDGFQYNWDPNPALFDPAVITPGITEIPGSETCLSFTNPSACRTHTIMFYANFTDVGIAATNPNGWDFEFQFQIANSLGGTWSTAQTQRNFAGDLNNTLSFGSELSVQTVTPGSTSEFCVRAIVNVVSVGAGNLQFWSNHATSIGYQTAAL